MSEQDWYAILNIEDNASEKDIARAFRKQSLKYHPDKNPGKEAEEKFHLLSRALDVLTNPSLREEFDKSRRAKVEALKRSQAFESQRRKLQEDLERREQESSKRQFSSNEANRRLELLKMEGLRKRKAFEVKESEKTNKKAHNEQAGSPTNGRANDLLGDNDNSQRRVRVKFNLPVISKEKLEAMFSRFGKIDTIVLLPQKKRYITALIEFRSLSGAVNCLHGDFQALARKEQDFGAILKINSFAKNAGEENRDRNLSSSPNGSIANTSADMSDQDYQAATLMRLRNMSRKKNGIKDFRGD